MEDEIFLKAYHAWSGWDRESDQAPEVGGLQLAEIQVTRDQQMRLVKNEQGDWLCVDFAPGMVDFTGFSIAGQLLADSGADFADIHIGNSEFAEQICKPVFSIFKAIKAAHVTTWQALYLPVRYAGSETVEIIAILEPVHYRQTYLEALINDLTFGLMTLALHPQDGCDQVAFQIIEANIPLARLFNQRHDQLSGMTLEGFWPEVDHETLREKILKTFEDGKPRFHTGPLANGSGEIKIKSRLSKAPWGMTLHFWDDDKGMSGHH